MRAAGEIGSQKPGHSSGSSAFFLVREGGIWYNSAACRSSAFRGSLSYLERRESMRMRSLFTVLLAALAVVLLPGAPRAGVLFDSGAPCAEGKPCWNAGWPVLGSAKAAEYLGEEGAFGLAVEVDVPAGGWIVDGVNLGLFGPAEVMPGTDVPQDVRVEVYPEGADGTPSDLLEYGTMVGGVSRSGYYPSPGMSALPLAQGKHWIVVMPGSPQTSVGWLQAGGGGGAGVNAMAKCCNSAATKARTWVLITDPLVPRPAITMTGLAASDVADGTQKRPGIYLAGMPNPFASSTSLSVFLPKAGDGKLFITSVDGRLVRTLYSGVLPQGVSRLTWDATTASGERAPVGTYYAKLQCGSVAKTLTLVLLR
jgi:hypothetical protein